MASPMVGLPVGTPVSPVGSPHNSSIMVIGSLNADLVTYTPRIPAAGETMAANGFRTGMGGKGANQAVACAKMGRRRDALARGTQEKDAVPVYMVGAVGDDVYGQSLTAALTAAGVDVSGVAVRTGQSTGVAVIIVDEAAGGENRIMLSAEANGSLAPDAYTASLPTTLAGHLPRLLLLQLEIPLATVLQILDTAHRQGVDVLLNAAPAQTLPDSYYKCITHLVVNETEASLLSGTALDLAVVDAAQRDKQLSRVAGHFLALGVQHVVITLGAAGVYHATASASGHVAAIKTKVVDTTAAGDTFIGAYALALVQGQTVADAVQWANRAAAVAVGRRGAQESIPWLDEL
ncbi:Putative ribokinase [Sporothrix curviconia]|uniref:Ribokinase n=1 Tax=Sporothrix curviconia TaxID=1260050 RepID=A0ABP0BGE1_9PEZI